MNVFILVRFVEPVKHIQQKDVRDHGILAEQIAQNVAIGYLTIGNNSKLSVFAKIM